MSVTDSVAVRVVTMVLTKTLPDVCDIAQARNKLEKWCST